MKEGFDAPPIGIRITRRDMEILKRLSTTMYPGLFLSMSDVARVLMREGMKAYGIEYGPGPEEEPEPPVVERSGKTTKKTSGVFSRVKR